MLKVDVLQAFVKLIFLKSVASTLDILPGVFVHEELMTYTNRSTLHPKYLRQAVLEVINNIPIGAILIYSNVSKVKFGHTSNGVYVRYGG
ncbi:uncharacterized protein TNCT_633151 [Trichonephila clavata]|uniref:Uncharacterized protein n=1 Tax=Trichonephila clavata TaxID=2740835 RepID=A0A8X6GZ63_TRICU|nr:uncharacterized protein TNCT_633151 [Trichonephila clavata]